MNWKLFHHPDWSLPVVRRRASEEWLDLLAGVGEILATRGRSAEWSRTYPTDRAYRAAMSRLQKRGLVVQVDPKAALPRLVLTEAGYKRCPPFQRPEAFWETKWNGIWYMLIFDVPEEHRSYRDVLRKILRRMRMGCLQKSVWITPQDIRPEYDDLEKSAAIGTVAYLMEARTVLHLDQQEMVKNAWDFERLTELQSRYLDVFTENLNVLKRPSCSSEDLMDLLYQESEAYVQSMRHDPLLPSPLLPDGYLGKEVWKLRNRLRSAIAGRL
jgi:phenylacetic acid degradation operon negative regulatory protein